MRAFTYLLRRESTKSLGASCGCVCVCMPITYPFKCVIMWDVQMPQSI